jgi:hypothetical protein
VRVVLALAVLLLAVAPQLDSETVLMRYAAALSALKEPKAMIFAYTVSQAGPTDIEQHHVIYRAGLDVRDELIASDGASLRHKEIRIDRRPDPYTVSALAPRADAYELLFLDAVRDGGHLDYVYATQPLMHAASGFVIDRVTIDGDSYLPRSIEFHTIGALATGTGSIEFENSGAYWVPLEVSVSAVVNGSVARERILFSGYRFPSALPRSTFL